MTNREKYLDSLSDVKLAELITDAAMSCADCPVDKKFCDSMHTVVCHKITLAWLKDYI